MRDKPQVDVEAIKTAVDRLVEKATENMAAELEAAVADAAIWGSSSMFFQTVRTDDGLEIKVVPQDQVRLSREEMERRAELEYLRKVVHHERSKADRLIKILTGIHNVLYPKAFEVDGKTYRFKPENASEFAQAISDRIRAIPDELAAIDTEQKTDT